MEPDDGIRGRVGVVLSLRDMPDGTVRVTLDDVENDAGHVGGDWRHRVFVTHKSYDAASIHELDLADSELASLGHYLLVRLNAKRSS